MHNIATLLKREISFILFMLSTVGTLLYTCNWFPRPSSCFCCFCCFFLSIPWEFIITLPVPALLLMTLLCSIGDINNNNNRTSAPSTQLWFIMERYRKSNLWHESGCCSCWNIHKYWQWLESRWEVVCRWEIIVIVIMRRCFQHHPTTRTNDRDIVAAFHLVNWW